MTNPLTRSARHEANAIFAQITPQDVEQFYASYQLWMLQQRIAEVQGQIATLTQQLADNTAHLQRVHPSAIALAALARLQSNGVNDIDLLDHMLERGEDWLDRTMQRLAYCEKFDFIRGNYTEWCEHSLEGAYDWIDSVEETYAEDGSTPSPASTPVSASAPDSDTSTDTQNQTTEEMLLQKLMSDEDEAAMYAPTLKIAALSPIKAQASTETPSQEQTHDSSVEQMPAQTNQTDQAPVAEEVIPGENYSLSTSSSPASTAQSATPVAEAIILSETGKPPAELIQAAYIPPSDERGTEENGEVPPENVPPFEQSSDENNGETNTQSAQKRGLLRRFFAAFFSRQ